MTVVFFGHRRMKGDLSKKLRSTIVDLIEHRGADRFYVGNQGAFDATVRRVLREVKKDYAHIDYAIALAYLRDAGGELSDFPTLFPDGMEVALPRFAIAKRNRWMVEQADIVITYVTHPFGGAAQFKAFAERKGKIVINLSE